MQQQENNDHFDEDGQYDQYHPGHSVLDSGLRFDPLIFAGARGLLFHVLCLIPVHFSLLRAVVVHLHYSSFTDTCSLPAHKRVPNNTCDHSLAFTNMYESTWQSGVKAQRSTSDTRYKT